MCEIQLTPSPKTYAYTLKKVLSKFNTKKIFLSIRKKAKNIF